MRGAKGFVSCLRKDVGGGLGRDLVVRKIAGQEPLLASLEPGRLQGEHSWGAPKR